MNDGEYPIRVIFFLKSGLGEDCSLYESLISVAGGNNRLCE